MYSNIPARAFLGFTRFTRFPERGRLEGDRPGAHAEMFNERADPR